MAEEANEAQGNQQPTGRSPLVSIVIALVILLLAAGGGFAVYQFVLAPRLAVDEDAIDDAVPVDEIPMNPINVAFDQKFVNVMRDSDEPAAMLVFQVTLECSDPIAADMINLHATRFEDMLIKLHDSRTRDELDDVLALKSSIQRQAKQRSNDLLNRLLGDEVEGDPRVTEVFHNLFMVQDQS